MEQKSFFKVSTLFIENLRVAINAISGNRLRSLLTIAIIAIGITSLVGILTATDALKSSVVDSFSKMGTNSFKISSVYSNSTSSVKKRVKNNRNITYEQAEYFKNNYETSSLVTIYCNAKSDQIVKYGSNKSNPIVSVIATDDAYLSFNGYELDKGRDISGNDLSNSSFVTLIGNGVRKMLFNDENPIGKEIMVSGVSYNVVGVLKKQGSSYDNNVENSILIPITNARNIFINDNNYYSIGVLPLQEVDVALAIAEAERVFRSARRLELYDLNDFQIRKSDAAITQMKKTMDVVTIAAALIGTITLIGAAVGLMNIMLVAVKERTREIGTRKAIGATSKRIKEQFLLESIVIGQLGGIFGIVIGVIVGNITSIVMETPFIVPWLWIFAAVVLCLLVSVLSGYLPAKRAASLDPIEALRYE